MFRVLFQPSPGDHDTVSTVSGWTGTAFPAQPRSQQVAVQVSLIPNTVDTVLWAPDDG